MDDTYTILLHLLMLHSIALTRGGGTDSAPIAAELAKLASLVEQQSGGAAPMAAAVPVRTGYDEWAATYRVHPVICETERIAVEAVLGGDLFKLALDVASGDGRFAKTHHQRAGHWVCTDLSLRMLKSADEHLRPSIQADFTQLPFPDCTFDLVTCSLAINHAADIYTTLREIGRVTQVGGTVLLTMTHHDAFTWLQWRAAYVEPGTAILRPIEERDYEDPTVTLAAISAGLLPRAHHTGRLTHETAKQLTSGAYDYLADLVLANFPALSVWRFEALRSIS